MNGNEALERARQFARMRYNGEEAGIVREHEKKLFEMRERTVANGTLYSSVTISETARINAEQIEALTWARLDSILEGYELHGIVVGDQMATEICDDIIHGMNNMIHRSTGVVTPGMPSGSEALHQQLLEKNVGVSADLIKTRIDRRRLMAKKTDGSTTIYNVQGDNARWNVNSTDNSVNIINKSTAEFFAALRERIASGVPEGDDQKTMLAKLTALEDSHGEPPFAQRYTDFIAAAANHMTLIGPFIPALTEMLHKVLS